jgi:hypothetical protein
VQDASGKWSGFEVELIDALFKQMGREYELVPISWTASFPALQGEEDRRHHELDVGDRGAQAGRRFQRQVL